MSVSLPCGENIRARAPFFRPVNLTCRIHQLWLLGGTLLFSLSLHAEVKLATPFRDGAILQRGKPLPVWGSSSSGESVRVEFQGQAKETVADSAGRWSVKLDPLQASSTPAELHVSGTNTIALKDILVGEVWLCSGQSNMNSPVAEVFDADREITSADYPLIRELRVHTAITDPPQLMVDASWQPCTPATARSLSATGYFFARELHRDLGIPIGIIKATLGGSPIEAWMSKEALASHPAFAPVAERWEAMRPHVKGDSLRNEPASLYNRFLKPLLPYSIAGFVWYQGEGNTERADEYALLLTTMILQWRRDFLQGDLPFLIVQLPRWHDPRDVGGDRWPRLREAQASALALPHTAMAVTLDVGDTKDLHPRNKQAVGKRLGLLALTDVYGRKVQSRGPTLSAIVREGPSLRLRFDHAEGLKVSGDSNQLFELAGADGKFLPAQARVDGASVVVTAEGLLSPSAVRFEWKNNPESFLLNDAGLPAAPFRKNDLP